MKILRIRQVTEMTGTCKASIYHWMSKGQFPRSIRLGPRAVGWRESEVLRWMETRDESRPRDRETD